jgi:hypothetical protein
VPKNVAHLKSLFNISQKLKSDIWKLVYEKSQFRNAQNLKCTCLNFDLEKSQLKKLVCSTHNPTGSELVKAQFLKFVQPSLISSSNF